MVDTAWRGVLAQFIQQAHTSDLKVSQYPKEYADLSMKVSFGMGMQARVPWISFTAPGMTVSNGYYPVYLYYREMRTLVLAYGVSETAEYSETWPHDLVKECPKIREVIASPPRYGDSWVFRSYGVTVSESGVAFLEDGAPASSELLSEDLLILLSQYKKALEIEVKDESSTLSTGLFYMESQLEDFIIENWNHTELGRDYELIYEDGALVSQQYQTDIGRIDILARVRGSKTHVVIELKKNQTSDDTMGQLMRYMGWVSEKLSDPNVKGVIIAGKFDQKLNYARKMLPQVEIYLYEVQFQLREYQK